MIVNDRKTERCYYFPVQRWVRCNARHKIEQFDTALPNVDPNKDQRDRELVVLQERYQYGQSAPDLPVQVRLLFRIYFYLD